ncbi:MAG: hypothetical protein IH904_00595 [Proteobacteria bacterium]|nr:hypothetical protein [Pseudomonadota bacterium]
MAKKLQEYTTAEFRRDMATVFENVHFRDTVVHVNRHGRRWVSIVSPEEGNFVRKIRDFGEIRMDELQEAISTEDTAVSIDELFDRVHKIREKNTIRTKQNMVK